MHIRLIGSLALILVLQAIALGAENDSQKIQYFLAREWGFECRRSDGSHVVRAVCARRIEEAPVREFLGSLPALDRLSIEFSKFGPGDIRSLARHCPSLSAIHITWHRGPETLDAALWAEFFEFQGLKHLSVENLHCSGDEKWSSLDGRELESLRVSGNLSGMLPALLAFCKVRSLRIEFRGPKQRLTADDHAALNSHTEIESLEILGDVFGEHMFVDLDALSELRKLRRLTLRQCSMDPLDLHRFPALQTLILHGCRFIRHEFDTLLAHPSLEELTLWECRNEDLRIAGPYARPSRTLRAITLRFPVFAEIKTFHSLPCLYDVELGAGGVCGLTDKYHAIRWMGPDEIASLERLKQLHSVSVIGGAGDSVEVSAAALVRLARIDTLRRLEVFDARIVQDLPPGGREQDSGLETVGFQARTPLRREFVTDFLGGNTRTVFVGPFSDQAHTASPSDNGTRVSPKEVHLGEITLPVFPSGLEGRLLGRSVENLVLDLCNVNKGAIQQLVSRSPSLKRLTLDMCLVQDERELLHLNELTELKWVNFANTTVSASTARAMKAESVRFGTWLTNGEREISRRSGDTTRLWQDREK